MQSHSLHAVSPKTKIDCFLKSISRANLSDQAAKDLLVNYDYEFQFVITSKIDVSNSPSTYYDIFFFDERVDNAFQITPTKVLKKGMIQVDVDGKLSIIDANFKLMDVNIIPLFRFGRILIAVDEELMRSRRPEGSCRIL